MTIREYANRLPVVTIAIVLAAIAISLFPETCIALQFDRDALAHGELWRLITGHLTHWTSNHLAWDLAAFALLGTLTERRSRGLLLATLVASALTISSAVWLLEPFLETYRGLSGVDSAMFAVAVALIISESIRHRAWRAALAPCIAALAFLAKMTLESTTEAPLFVTADASFIPVPLAHVIGAATGAVTAALACAQPLRTIRRPSDELERST